jgi:hypothetical protein
MSQDYAEPWMADVRGATAATTKHAYARSATAVLKRDEAQMSEDIHRCPCPTMKEATWKAKW